MRPRLPSPRPDEVLRLMLGGTTAALPVRLLTHSTPAAALAAVLAVIGFAIADLLISSR